MTLTTKQIKSIACLLDVQNRTNEQAAQAAGVSRRVMQTWLSSDPEYQTALREAEAELVAHASRRLLSLTDDAIAALAQSLDEYAKPMHSLRAAELVLSHVLRWRETLDFEQRLAALEAGRANT